MDFQFNGLFDWSAIITYVFVASLGATIIFFLLSEMLTHFIHLRQKRIYKNFEFFSNLDNLSYAQKRELVGPYSGHVSIHKVLFTFKKCGVTYTDVAVGYLKTDDYSEDGFDEPFNRFLMKTLLGHPSNVEEGQFSLAKIPPEELSRVRRDVAMKASDVKQTKRLMGLRRQLWVESNTVTRRKSILDDINPKNLKYISQV